MAQYSFEEMADMHFMYGRANGNACQARRLYADSFPGRVLPCTETFTNLHRRLCERGSFAISKHDCGRSRTTRSVENEERILQVVAENPRISVRRTAIQEGIPKSTVWEIIHDQLLYPYHFQRVQALKPEDLARRIHYCQWVREQLQVNRFFLTNVLFTDEATFTRDGIINYHNTHVWAEENPHEFLESRHQDKFCVNIWAGIIGDFLIGPFVLPNRLNGQQYLNFLENDLLHLLDDVPYQLRNDMFFMHDGAPPHFALNVREHLNRMYPGRWIGRGGPVYWPPRSPDLNPLDYFLWGYLKALVYATPVDTLEELQQRVFNACDHVRNIPGIFSRVRSSMEKRIRGCIEMNGGHFQHLL